jgi:tumor protein p73
VQICSCPKRDKERDENDLQNPRTRRTQEKKLVSMSPPVPPPEEDTESSVKEDHNIYSLKLDVLGEENYKSVLKYAYDVMAGYAVKTGNFEILKKCGNEL